ncbi:MAG TPA: 5'-nucleotidase, lipoprotein e(P4) family [Bacteroidales bacterium]|nr:5'-nucleotidase, lipoprotein e(P4) family [Bacteroidales bacterium]
MKKIIPVLISLIFAACTTNQTVQQPTANSNANIVYATLYNYFSAEYKALSYQAYNTATSRIDQLKKEFPDKKNMAVIVDIDETVLDNSPYEAKLIELNVGYDSCWNTWCNLSAARPVPGAVEFLQHADSLGFDIFYVSNRKEKFTRKGTLENLRMLGFPQLDDAHIYLRTETSDKEPRRHAIAADHEIVLLVGDNIGDFYEDTSDYAKRDSTVKAMKKQFGKKFIVLPNAMYGNWPASLHLSDKVSVDSLLHVMTKAFGNTCGE